MEHTRVWGRKYDKMRIPAATRMIARILALTLVVMASASGGSWRCLDGTLCQADCGMGAGHGAANAITVLSDSECGSCPESRAFTGGRPSSLGVSNQSSCFLSADERPVPSVQERAPIPLELVSLIPAAVELVLTPRAEAATTSEPPSIQERSRRPYIGRAPPLAS